MFEDFGCAGGGGGAGGGNQGGGRTINGVVRAEAGAVRELHELNQPTGVVL